MKKRSLRSLLNEAIKIQSKIDSLKKHYEQLEEITNELSRRKFRQHVSRTHVVTLKDNFSKKNVAYRTTSIKRFELEIE